MCRNSKRRTCLYKRKIAQCSGVKMPGGYQKADLSYLFDANCGHQVLGRTDEHCSRIIAATIVPCYPTGPATGNGRDLLGTTGHFYGPLPWGIDVRFVCTLSLDGHTLCISPTGLTGRRGKYFCR